MADATPEKITLSVYAPKFTKADDELVDSEKGLPWHEVAADAELYAKVRAGKVEPMTRKAFTAKGKKADSK